MAWTAPMTAVVGAVLTAAQWNQHVRDNFLETAPAKATTAGGYFVSTGVNAIAERTLAATEDSAVQATGSTSYVTLNAGPVATATTGTSAMVHWAVRFSNNTLAQNSYTTFAVGGATTIAAVESYALFWTQPVANNTVTLARSYLLTSLTPGINSFTMQHRVTGGTGTFDERWIAVTPY